MTTGRPPGESSPTEGSADPADDRGPADEPAPGSGEGSTVGRGSGSGLRAGRRSFLAGAGVAAVAALGATAVIRRTGPTDSSSPSSVPFRSPRQQGVLRPPTSAGLVASFDVAVTSAAELADTLGALSVEIDRLMAAEPAQSVDEIRPPIDSGIVGAGPGPVGTSVVLAVGASLFDDRFGLGDRRPRELLTMPTFFNDRLVQPDLSHGDLALMVTADTQQAAVYALHQVVRVTDRRLQLRWVQEGYNELLPPSDGGIAPTRNLMGFRDGTSNLDTADPAEMAAHVWVGSDDAEPAWTVGGTYLAVRIIRILVEFWATAALVRQEQIVGRHRASGAPLGQSDEGDVPAFATDPDDQSVPLASHIRRGNPRRADTGRILRRGFSYLNGADGAGQLDQGLLFMAFQRSMTNGFLSVQARLDGEPMEDYIKPVGGGFFFVVPGPGTGGDGWLGQSLLEG